MSDQLGGGASRPPSREDALNSTVTTPVTDVAGAGSPLYSENASKITTGPAAQDVASTTRPGTAPTTGAGASTTRLPSETTRPGTAPAAQRPPPVFQTPLPPPATTSATTATAAAVAAKNAAPPGAAPVTADPLGASSSNTETSSSSGGDLTFGGSPATATGTSAAVAAKPVAAPPVAAAAGAPLTASSDTNTSSSSGGDQRMTFVGAPKAKTGVATAVAAKPVAAPPAAAAGAPLTASSDTNTSSSSGGDQRMTFVGAPKAKTGTAAAVAAKPVAAPPVAAAAGAPLTASSDTNTSSSSVGDQRMTFVGAPKAKTGVATAVAAKPVAAPSAAAAGAPLTASSNTNTSSSSVGDQRMTFVGAPKAKTGVATAVAAKPVAAPPAAAAGAPLTASSNTNTSSSSVGDQRMTFVGAPKAKTGTAAAVAAKTVAAPPVAAAGALLSASSNTNTSSSSVGDQRMTFVGSPKAKTGVAAAVAAKTAPAPPVAAAGALLSASSNTHTSSSSVGDQGLTFGPSRAAEAAAADVSGLNTDPPPAPPAARLSAARATAPFTPLEPIESAPSSQMSTPAKDEQAGQQPEQQMHQSQQPQDKSHPPAVEKKNRPLDQQALFAEYVDPGLKVFGGNKKYQLQHALVRRYGSMCAAWEALDISKRQTKMTVADFMVATVKVCQVLPNADVARDVFHAIKRGKDVFLTREDFGIEVAEWEAYCAKKENLRYADYRKRMRSARRRILLDRIQHEVQVHEENNEKIHPQHAREIMIKMKNWKIEPEVKKILSRNQTLEEELRLKNSLLEELQKRCEDMQMGLDFEGYKGVVRGEGSTVGADGITALVETGEDGRPPMEEQVINNFLIEKTASRMLQQTALPMEHAAHGAPETPVEAPTLTAATQAAPTTRTSALDDILDTCTRNNEKLSAHKDYLLDLHGKLVQMEARKAARPPNKD